jgi:hypothetical protein
MCLAAVSAVIVPAERYDLTSLTDPFPRSDLKFMAELDGIEFDLAHSESTCMGIYLCNLNDIPK